MAGFSDYLEGAIMDWLFEGSAIATKTNTFISLHTADPGDTPAANELADANGYVRISTGASDWEGTTGIRQNSGELAFAAASGADWGTITHFGLWDAIGVGSGNFLGGGTISPNKSVYDGDQLKFTSGNLDFTLD